MVRSTSCSTCTAPKLLLMPRSWSSGSAMGPPRATVGLRSACGPGATGVRAEAPVPRGTGAPPAPDGGDRSGDAGLRAERGVLPGADVRLVDRAVVDGGLDVLLRDRDRREQHRGDVPLAGVVADGVGGLALLTL